MKRMIFSMGVLMFLWAFTAQAHPPTDIVLSYNHDEQVLHVKMKHVTSDPQEHRIRQIIVFLNGQDFEHHFFVQQTSAEGLDEELYVPAEEGDVIRIKAICSQAGFAEAEIMVPAKEVKAEKEE